MKASKWDVLETLMPKLSICKITILLSGNASTLCWDCPRWRHTSTDTWMSSSVQSPHPRPRHPPPAPRSAGGECEQLTGRVASTAAWQQLMGSTFNLKSISSRLQANPVPSDTTVLYCTQSAPFQCEATTHHSMLAHPKLFCPVFSFTQLICDLYASSENVFVDFPRKFCEMFDDNHRWRHRPAPRPVQNTCHDQPRVCCYIMYPQHWF